MEKISVCAVCMHSEPAQIEENLNKIEKFSSEAALKKAHIVCFPEFSVTGYLLNDPADRLAHFSYKYIVDRLIQIARKCKITVIAGLVEFKESKPYITQVIVGVEGIIGIYRKTHLSPLEKKVYKAGNEIRVFSIAGISCGIQLCYEAHFPELSTIMALMGAELIFIPHASPRGTPQDKMNSWLRHLRARAFDNSVFIVSCNQVGKTKENFDFPGVAIAIGPDGEIIDYLLTEKEDMLLITINKELLFSIRSNKMRYFLPHRRPELYLPIIKKEATLL